jgi:iron complex outermembrane receptor protein
LLIAASCPGGPLTFARCDAQPLARSPEWTYTAGTQYTLPLTTGALNFSANYAYKDEQFSNNSTSNSILLPSYAVTSVRLEYDSGNAWKVAAFGTNVLDEEYITTGTNGRGNVLGTVSQSPGRPAEWGLTATWQF